MRTLLEKCPAHQDKSIFFDQVIDEFTALNRARNAYTHGLWYTGPDGLLYLEEETDEYGICAEKRRVTPREAQDVVERLVGLSDKIAQYHMDALRNRLMQPSQDTSPQPSCGSSPPQDQGTT